jgi:hypothetical protein
MRSIALARLFKKTPKVLQGHILKGHKRVKYFRKPHRERNSTSTTLFQESENGTHHQHHIASLNAQRT